LKLNDEEIIENEDYYRLPKEEWTSYKNEQLGKTGELIIACAVKTLYKKKNGWIVHCNKFGGLSEYKINCGMDITVEKEVAIEVKNFNRQKRSYGLDFVETKVLSRRKDKTLPALLVMTYSNLLTKASKKLLLKEGWAVLYLEHVIVNLKDWKEIYPLAQKLKIAIAEAKAIHKQKLSSTKNQSLLPVQ
jgi:hypothetical protein